MSAQEPMKPRALRCPSCGGAVYRLSLGGRWARWWAWLRRQRPYACATCGWRGKLVYHDPHTDVIDELPWFRAREPVSRKDPPPKADK